MSDGGEQRRGATAGSDGGEQRRRATAVSDGGERRRRATAASDGGELQRFRDAKAVYTNDADGLLSDIRNGLDFGPHGQRAAQARHSRGQAVRLELAFAMQPGQG